MLFTQGGMKYSTNDGETWNDILSFDPNSTMIIKDFAVNSLGHIFLSINDKVYNGIFRSFDYGATQFAQTSMKDEGTNFIAIDSKRKIYITVGVPWDNSSSNSEVYFSTDEGDTWQWIGNGENEWITALAVTPFDRVFIATNNKIFLFNDYLKNWSNITSGLPNILDFLYWSGDRCFGFDNDGFAYLGTAGTIAMIGNNGIYGIFKSKNKIITDIKNQGILSPKVFSLSQNYPNPFNPTTKIEFSIPQTSLVSLKVYDVLGREIATFIYEEKPEGVYNIIFNGSNLSSGVYFYQLKSGNFVETKKFNFGEVRVKNFL